MKPQLFLFAAIVGVSFFSNAEAGQRRHRIQRDHCYTHGTMPVQSQSANTPISNFAGGIVSNRAIFRTATQMWQPVYSQGPLNPNPLTGMPFVPPFIGD